MTADRRNLSTFLLKLASVCSQNKSRHRSIDDAGAIVEIRNLSDAARQLLKSAGLSLVSSQPLDGRRTMNRMSRNSLRTNILESCAVSPMDAARTVKVGLPSVASVVIIRTMGEQPRGICACIPVYLCKSACVHALRC
jgi:hypothetical protein